MAAVLRVATRGSDLALTQAGQVASALERSLGVRAELLVIKTQGDRIQGRPLSEVGGKGLFVKEIEEALLDGRADVAIHSAKDLPAEMAPGLVVGAAPERADPRDALIGGAPTSLAELPRGARVGTGSLRRRAQLLAARPDLVVVGLRGNIDTRLRKLREEGLAAVVLACAGLDRLTLGGRIHERIPTESMLPAVAQGILAVQTRADAPLADDLAVIDHAPTRTALEAERGFLIALAGDCNVPLASYAEVDDGRVRLRSLLATPDGRKLLRDERSGEARDAEALGRAAAEAVLSRGGAALLAELR